MWTKIKRVMAGVGIVLMAFLAWLAGHFKKKAEREERRADSAEVQNDVYKKANEVQESIKQEQKKAEQVTGTDISSALDDWNNGV